MAEAAAPAAAAAVPLTQTAEERRTGEEGGGGQRAGTGLEHARHPGTDWRFVEIIIEMKISMM